MAAYDGPPALELAHNKQPVLVVRDVMLPDLDGVEVCRRLRAFSGDYVLMLTARTEGPDRVVGRSVGSDDYLTKPLSPREVVARVRAMLHRDRAVNQARAPQHPHCALIDESRHLRVSCPSTSLASAPPTCTS